MKMDGVQCVTAFMGMRRVASGTLGEVVARVQDLADGGGSDSVLVFDDETGEQVEVDPRGTAGARPDGAADRGPEEVPRGPGRPRLGVVAREVTLLPRHWEWLGGQPGGASVALRKLVEEARRRNEAADQARHAREAAYRFLTAVGGNLPGYEEALRALFASDRPRFERETSGWPVDVRDHALKLAGPAFAPIPA